MACGRPAEPHPPGDCDPREPPPDERVADRMAKAEPGECSQRPGRAYGLRSRASKAGNVAHDGPSWRPPVGKAPKPVGLTLRQITILPQRAALARFDNVSP
jgi:hypothetical protein